jgi:hypothetical protein
MLVASALIPDSRAADLAVVGASEAIEALTLIGVVVLARTHSPT